MRKYNKIEVGMSGPIAIIRQPDQKIKQLEDNNKNAAAYARDSSMAAATKIANIKTMLKAMIKKIIRIPSAKILKTSIVAFFASHNCLKTRQTTKVSGNPKFNIALTDSKIFQRPSSFSKGRFRKKIGKSQINDAIQKGKITIGDKIIAINLSLRISLNLNISQISKLLTRISRYFFLKNFHTKKTIGAIRAFSQSAATLVATSEKKLSIWRL